MLSRGPILKREQKKVKERNKSTALHSFFFLQETRAEGSALRFFPPANKVGRLLFALICIFFLCSFRFCENLVPHEENQMSFMHGTQECWVRPNLGNLVVKNVNNDIRNT